MATSSSVIGLDVGGSKACVAKVEEGGVVVLSNEMSSRVTPTAVSLPVGASAVRSAGAGISNSVSELRNLLGLKHQRPEVWKTLKDADKVKDGGESVSVNSKESVLPEQIMASFLTHLDQKVVDNGNAYYVIAVPHYLTDVERAAMLDSASVSGLKVVDLINDLSAAALAYGYFQKDLTTAKRKVAFVDFGYSAIQAALVEYDADGFKVINVQSDRSVGGKTLDAKIAADKFAADFLAGNGSPLTKKSMAKLVSAAEKAKKMMSAVNKNSVPVNVECLQDDLDFNGSITRQEFEHICGEEFAKVKECLANLVAESGCSLEELHSVELLGGSSRIPLFRDIAAEVFGGNKVRSTLNADETVAKGAALHCAALTSVFSVRPFRCHADVTVHGVQAKYVTSSGNSVHKVNNEEETTVTLTQRPEGDTVALEYEETHPGGLARNLIAVYQLKGIEEQAEIVMRFRSRHGGRPYLASCHQNTEGGAARPVQFQETRLGGLTSREMDRLKCWEEAMRTRDAAERNRQEMKNRFEDATFQFKDLLADCAAAFQAEEAWQLSSQFVRRLQQVIDDDEHSDWPVAKYADRLKEVTEKMTVFGVWRDKYQDYLETKKKRRVRDDVGRHYEQPPSASPPRGSSYAGHYPARYMSFNEDEDDLWFDRLPRYRQQRPMFHYFW